MKIGFLLCLMLPLLGITQEKIQIKGKIKGLSDGSTVSLTNVNQPDDTLGKAIVRQGKFLIKSEIKESMLVSLNLAPGKTILTFIDGSKSRLKGDVANTKAIRWRGSASVNDFTAFKKGFDPLFEKVVSINQQVRQQGWTDSLSVTLDGIKDTIQQSIDQFIGKRSSSPVSAFLLAATYQLNDDIFLSQKRLNSLKASALNNLYGNYLKETIGNEIETAVGATAQDFSQADTSGVPVSLSSFRGKYVLLDFWASWCGPCRQENPNVVANYQKFKDKNFTVLGVSLDRPGQKTKWLQAIYADQLTWTHVSDLQFWNNEVAQQYKVQSIPQNFLIGPDGKILAKNLRGPNLEVKLCELLGCSE